MSRSYSEFYKDAWRENVYGASGESSNLNSADDTYWTAYAYALQAFERAHGLAKQGFLLHECKEIYLASLENKGSWNDQ